MFLLKIKIRHHNNSLHHNNILKVPSRKDQRERNTVVGGRLPKTSIKAWCISFAVPSKNLPQPDTNRVSPVWKIICLHNRQWVFRWELVISKLNENDPTISYATSSLLHFLANIASQAKSSHSSHSSHSNQVQVLQPNHFYFIASSASLTTPARLANLASLVSPNQPICPASQSV